MGVEVTVTFDAGAVPSWAACRESLNQHGIPVQMRMIDGMPAFPDETPPEPWRELRVATAHGMVTIRRDHDRIAFVTWGNADAEMVRAWNALIWTFAEVGHGRVDSPSGPLLPAEFRRTADLPVSLRGES